jgi:bacteriocin biosynthesis cyclodehydratase domain-containing protein
VDALARPRFKSSVEPIVSSDDGLFLLSEVRNTWVREPIYAALAPMLDGAHDVEAIFSALVDRYPAEHVFAALDRLRLNGYLAEDAASDARPAMAFWEHIGVPPSVARSRLAATVVSVVSFGEIDVGPLTGVLADVGVNVGRDGDVSVVVTNDYLHPRLAVWNRQSLSSGKAWLLARPMGLESWIGPMFVPGQTACWECLAQRLRGHRKLETYLARRNGTDAPVGAVPAFIASTRHAALAETATEISRWIATGGQSPLLNRVIATSVLTLQRTHHTLTRRPQCAACGSAKPQDGAHATAVRLEPRAKARTSDGGHRALDQREALRRLERHLSPITGIVSALVQGERTAGGEAVTPLFAADHNFSDMHDDRFFLQEGMRRRSGGKGISVEQARASALAESLERYCGVFDGTEPRIRAVFADLGDAAIHPNACMGYSERQYAERQAHNTRGHKAYWVPQPFRDDVAIEWTPLWSLSSGQTRYLPTSLCYYGYRSPDPVFGRADSNGCAAGSVLEEAVLQGLLELIERDAVALWWYNRVRRRGVDLDSADDPYVSELLRHYRDLRRDVWVLDVTSDFGIPTLAALSKRVDKVEEDIIYGFGAHLDPRIALTRALTELNQSLEAVPAATGPASHRTYRGNEDAIRWWRTVRSAQAAYLVPDLEAGPRRLQDFDNLASDDLRQDILSCVDLAKARGIEVLVLEQTRPDVGCPVVRVVAPELRHFWARFGPGRLYHVPLQQGWLRRPREEDELNPFVIQF